ncbi:MAG: hypothetical protein E7452_00030 [Ruminococcaceae bacterium]|nr:hypothetical protein [Oscillospiraceae bacterium]
MSDPNAFTYNYSAKEQAEIKKIREKYAPRTVDSPEGKLERVRRLDASVTQKATAWALALGVIGTLVLGIGMCCCLVREQFFLGILIGLLGTLTLALAYPVYTLIIARERKRIAPEILQLTDELMQK